MARHALRYIWASSKSAALLVLWVVGGFWVFLTVAPVFGYLPYSDRPGAGWWGRFPALSLGEAMVNAWKMLEYAAFFAVLFVVGAFVCVILVDSLADRITSEPLKRTLTGLIAAAITWYSIAGIGWYIALGEPAVWFAAALGALAGAWWLPNRSRESPRRPPTPDERLTP